MYAPYVIVETFHNSITADPVVGRVGVVPPTQVTPDQVIVNAVPSEIINVIYSPEFNERVGVLFAVRFHSCIVPLLANMVGVDPLIVNTFSIIDELNVAEFVTIVVPIVVVFVAVLYVNCGAPDIVPALLYIICVSEELICGLDPVYPIMP